ncbi:MAG TPA: cytochrome c [Gemmatimonadales bacterium]|nr:cytochrome c [Gemmatimonadales bacterium]
MRAAASLRVVAVLLMAPVGAAAQAMKVITPPPPSPADTATRGLASNEEGQPPKLPPLPSGMTVDLIVTGDSLFHTKGQCFACHGADAGGLPDAGSALTLGLNFVPLEWGPIDALIAGGIPEAITRSAIRMPPKGGKSDLSPAETRAIAAYVWAISQTRGEPWPGGHVTHAAMIPPGSAGGTASATPAR